MKITDKTDRTVTIEMTHKQALMINAFIRESCTGAELDYDEFDTRVGYPRKVVGEICSELHDLLCDDDLLYEAGVSGSWLPFLVWSNEH